MPDTPTLPPETPEPKPKRAGANTVAPPPPDVLLLSFGQAAYVLGVSVTSVRRAVEEGELRSVAFLKRTLISREAIADFIRRGDLAKAPTSEAAARVSAEERALQEQRARIRVVADWNTGKDTFGIGKEPKVRLKKSAQG